MAVLGRACLLLALAVCAYGIGASLYGVRTGRVEFSESGRRSVYALAGILTVAFAVLEVAFLRNDFAFNTVADTSSRTTPAFYRAAAVWSSQEGSLLLWAWLMSLWSSLALFLTRRRMRDVAGLRDGDPARLRRLLRLADGLLREPVPDHVAGAGRRRGARSAAALPDDDDPPADALLGLHAVHDPARVRHGRAARRAGSTPTGSASIRRFAFAAWLFLGVGILLGARWSYSELGWGGYWGWDAVENASLMPWLTGTAFLHSLMIQEKRGMLKVWNVLARAGHGDARDHGHVPRAQRDPQLDPRVRRRRRWACRSWC